MRVPKRRYEISAQAKIKHDPLITQQKFNELQAKLEKMKVQLPEARTEVARLAEMGDFSENAAYQMAKGRLRSLNSRILQTEHIIKHSQVIQTSLNNNSVQVGGRVVVEVSGQKKEYTILGSSETNPSAGLISRKSPIGEALLGLEVGDEVEVELANKKVKYKVLKID